MKVKFWGTRGSAPIAAPDRVKYGGNTTCFEVTSRCLPSGTALVVDTGTGFLPMSQDALGREIKGVHILYTHWHHDHTMGLPLSPLTFSKGIGVKLYGPVDSGIGPREMLESLMQPPFFPVHAIAVKSHFKFQDIEHPGTMVILVHPEGGFKVIDLDQYEILIGKGSYLPIGKGKYPLDQCLGITMYKSDHPEQTISYRFQEHPTGKTFVVLTDHENGDGIPRALREHLRKADLLIMDSQYSRARYNSGMAGFGHGTPDYCVRVAGEIGAKKLGLTHHDPGSNDKDVDAILAEALSLAKGKQLKVFACADYQEIEV